MEQSSERTYIAIDLKSFFASVECVEAGKNPLDTNLVVADASRTEKTICLAVSPTLKAYGIPGRARLFEVIQKVEAANRQRQWRNNGKPFTGKSFINSELQKHPDWEIDFMVATPRMSYYIDYSTKIYNIYLKYVAPEDIHVYSIDEVFIDITNYLSSYKMTAREITMKMILDILNETGITATAGIGTNLYLCKIAMDIVAKHIPADENGVRIAELDEISYRRQLWDHKPLTDFWRVGRGTAKRLAQVGIFTMGELARLSLEAEGFLYKQFGVNAELLIDHAWGWESCTMKEIKAYKPSENSLSSGQVLQSPYTFAKARVVVAEMAESAALTLVEKKLVTNQLVLTINYDAESLIQNENYNGETTTDYYGRIVPKESHGTANLNKRSSSTKVITNAILHLYDTIVNPSLLIRRITITTNHVVSESAEQPKGQLELFPDFQDAEEDEISNKKEREMQETILSIKKRFGKNAILKGLNFKEGATAKERNKQIGGHKA